MSYNWQQSDWPNFRYNLDDLGDILLTIAEKMGHVGGVVRGLPETMQSEAIVDLIVTEAVKNSEIEGEFLSREDVMSSIRNNLGLGAALIRALRGWIARGSMPCLKGRERPAGRRTWGSWYAASM